MSFRVTRMTVLASGTPVLLHFLVSLTTGTYSVVQYVPRYLLASYSLQQSYRESCAGITQKCAVSWLMLYTRLASPVAVCIAIRGRYTRLACLANPNPNAINPSYGQLCVYMAGRVYRLKLLATSATTVIDSNYVYQLLITVMHVRHSTMINFLSSWHDN